jgi:excisionase family DNA binding protein
MKIHIQIEGKSATLEVDAREFLIAAAWSPEIRVAMQRMTRKDIAKHFQVAVRTIDRWKAENVIPFIKIGDNVRFDLWDVAEHVRKKHLVRAP